MSARRRTASGASRSTTCCATGGPERVLELLRQLQTHTQEQGVSIPFTANTPYINTIPRSQQPVFPGNRALERRIKSLLRWNAMAMVTRANRELPGIGGHISTYASAATLWEIGFNHFWRGRTDDFLGDFIFFQGHGAPGIYARAFLEGRLTDRDLQNFRRELSEGGGLSSYPHPYLMPDFWQFPTVSMGLGPADRDLPRALQPLPRRPRPARALRRQGLGPARRRRDGRARVARRHHPRRARATGQPHLRHQLQPAAPRRPRARQRQDHPGTRGRLPRRRLVRDQGHLGRRLGPPPRARHQRQAPAAPGRGPRRRDAALHRQRRRLHPRALLRQVPRAARTGRRLQRRADPQAAPAAATTPRRSTPPTSSPPATAWRSRR